MFAAWVGEAKNGEVLAQRRGAIVAEGSVVLNREFSVLTVNASWEHVFTRT